MNDLLPNINPEEKLLLSLCRLDFNEEQKAEIGDLIKKIKDWDRFVKLVNDHGIIALTAYNIREIGLADHVPESSMKILENGHMRSLIRNTWLVERWKEVNKILSEAGIKHVLLKGMALEHTVYGSKGLRQMNDNDILIKKEEALRAWTILQSHGFIPEIIKSPLHRKIISETGKHLPTLRKEGYAVEIHIRLFHDPVKDARLDEAIDKALKIEIDGSGAFILENEIHLEYLKYHNRYHLSAGRSQLRLILDMNLLYTGSIHPLPEGFILNPHWKQKVRQNKNSYISHYFSLPPDVRLRYLIGDIFPSLRWMKQRHHCGSVKALLYYPQRLGKLVWLMEGMTA
jgi:hypothetical protein